MITAEDKRKIIKYEMQVSKLSECETKYPVLKLLVSEIF